MNVNIKGSDRIRFRSFCELCDKILVADKPRKHGIIKSFMNNWRNIYHNSNDFFPIMRLLIPQLDRDRSAYGIKEHVLAKMYTRILCLPPQGDDALKLLNYRSPKVSGRLAGDFAEVAFWILKMRCGPGDMISVQDVNQSLSEMAMKHAQHDPRGVDAVLTTLVSAMSPEEQKWLIRIILKEMNLGIGPNTVLDVFHPDAREYFDTTSSLSKLCQELRDPEVRVNEIDIQLFHPFRPMLSEELDIKRLDLHFNRSALFFTESKMDGERFQIHMQDGNFKYFSRRAFEYTENFGSNALVGMLTPHLAKLISPNVTSVILDGEMMCWDTRKEKFTTKGMEIDVKKLNESHVHRPCFCPFDVLYLNGEVLTKKPLHSRLLTLHEILTPQPGVLTFVPSQRVTAKEQVCEALNKAIDDCEEGIILKEFDAIYKPNARKNGGWYKIKPEYSDGLMDTLDLLVIGGYYGEGRFGGTISQFLLAVRHGESFWSTVRVGCGYSRVELEALQKALEPHWRHCDGSKLDNVVWTKQKPDVWIEPQHSKIFEVKASEIVPSNEYQTGCTLRFPRVIAIREDRNWMDCCTYEELESKRKKSLGKLATHHFTDEDSAVPVKKLRRSKTVLADQFKGANLGSVDTVSNILAGKEICVLSGYLKLTKHDVEKKIVKFGGKIVQNPGAKTWCVLSDVENIRVKNISASGMHDVLKCSWLIPLLSRQLTSMPDIPRHAYMCVSYVTGSKLRKSYDQFGDHYSVPATLSSLKDSMDVARKVTSAITEVDKCELDLEIFSGNNPYSIFRGLVATSPDRLGIDVDFIKKLKLSVFRLALLQFSLYGGKITALNDGIPTHCLCSRQDQLLLSLVKDLRKTSLHKFKIVSYDWVVDSIAKKELLPENCYIL